jgi:hypothetical protein
VAWRRQQQQQAASRQGPTGLTGHTLQQAASPFRLGLGYLRWVLTLDLFVLVMLQQPVPVCDRMLCSREFPWLTEGFQLTVETNDLDDL